MFIVNNAANTLISHRTVLSLFRLIGARSRFGSDAGIRLVRSTGIRSSSGISSLISLMLVLLSPAYAGFSYASFTMLFLADAHTIEDAFCIVL